MLGETRGSSSALLPAQGEDVDGVDLFGDRGAASLSAFEEQMLA
jgi:hypothetical protein